MTNNNEEGLIILKTNLDKRNDDDAKISKDLLTFSNVPKIKFNKTTIQNISYPKEIKPELKEIISKLLLNTLIMNKRHLEVCSCMRPYIQQKTIINQNKIKKEILNSYPINSYEIKRILNDYEDKTLKQILNECINDYVICKYEKDIVIDLVEKFSNRYDFKDPRVFVLFNQLVLHMLDAHRMGFDSLTEGVTTNISDKIGNRVVVVNPSIEVKRRIGDSIVSTIEKLDKIIEGEKSVVGVIDLTDNIKKVWEMRKQRIKEENNANIRDD